MIGNLFSIFGKVVKFIVVGLVLGVTLVVTLMMLGVYITSPSAAEREAAETKRRSELTQGQRDAEDAAVKAKADRIKAEDAKFNDIYATLTFIKREMRNPDSFAVDTVLYKPGTVCVVYRAQNGFGGMNMASAVTVNNTVHMSPDAAFVKKHCSGTTNDSVSFRGYH